MQDAAATRKREVPDEELFAGLTEAEKKFLLDLGDFLAKYPNYGGETPYNKAIAVGLQAEVHINPRGRPVGFLCHHVCYDSQYRPYCCLYSAKAVSRLE
jgi:hypothetical protein